MVVTYCTSAEIAKFIQRVRDGSDFTDETKPSQAAVEAQINRSEDLIDSLTNHTWRSVQIDDEYHDYLLDRSSNKGRRWHRTIENSISLHHRKIRSFTSGTDKIEIWDGGDWVDLALDANGYTEGRDEDYWINYDQGVIYFVSEIPAIGRDTIRVTYHYGDTVVPGDICEWCIQQTVLKLLLMDSMTSMIREGTDAISLSEKVRILKEDIAVIQNRYEELRFA